MKKVELGDVFKIPFNDRVALAHVVWISSIIKDVIGFSVFDSLYLDDRPDEEQLKPTTYKKIMMFAGDVTVLYGDKKNIKKNIWQRVGNTQLDDETKDSLFHNIGGSLYQGNDFQKFIPPEEYSNYPKVLTAGNKAVENLLENAFKE